MLPQPSLRFLQKLITSPAAFCQVPQRFRDFFPDDYRLHQHPEGWGSSRLIVLIASAGVHYYPHTDQVRKASRLQFLDNVGAMQLDSPEANAEMAGDHLVGLARDDQLKDLTLTGCQQSGTSLQRGAFEALFISPI